MRLIFDLDDTLIPTRYRYSLAKYQSGRAIAEAMRRHCTFEGMDWLYWSLVEKSMRCARAIVDDLQHMAPYGADLLRQARRAMRSRTGSQFRVWSYNQGWIEAYRNNCRSEEDVNYAVFGVICAVAQAVRDTLRKIDYSVFKSELGDGYGIKLIETQENIDEHMIREYDFGVSRFPDSWVAAYEDRCIEHGFPYEQPVADQVRSAAFSFSRSPFNAYVEAHKVLLWAIGQGHELYLLTIGDEELQRRKIAETGLDRYFDSNKIFVAAADKRSIMRRLAGRHPEQVVMIGDSLRSDIAAAQDIGIRAVHIGTSGHWRHDDAVIDADRCIALRSLRDLPTAIEKLAVGE